MASNLLDRISKTAVELRRATVQREALNLINTNGRTLEELEKLAVDVALAIADEARLRCAMQLLVNAYAEEENEALNESLQSRGGRLDG